MIYTIRKANMIAEQLRRFTSDYSHHVAGQFANIDFWLSDVKEALNTIDQYRIRFNNMATAQKEWVEIHHTKVHSYCPYCEGRCEFSTGEPAPPVKKSGNEMNKARKQLVDAAYYFLARCYKLKLLNEEELKQKCDFIGTSIDPYDLKN